MTVTLDGVSLRLAEVVRVSRDHEPVALAEVAVDLMTRASSMARRHVDERTVAYGITTGVGVRKSITVADEGHDRLLLGQHLIAHGEPLPSDVVRAAALRLANALAGGTSAARPALAQRIVDAINDDALPAVRSLGSVGVGDLAQTAELADGLLAGFELAQGEAIALLNQNAFATGHAALALHDASLLVASSERAAALSLEAFAANRESLLHPAIALVRGSAGVRTSLERLRALVEGGSPEARALQDPLSFRTIPQLHGAVRDALGFALDQLDVELNGHQSNPLAVVDEDRFVSVGNFEIAGLAMALDLARLAVGQLVTAGAERAVKLLQAPLTGLPEGLGERPHLAESALSELGIAVQALAAEARLLAQPVSLELVSTTQAEGIEDRTTMTPLAARRLADQVALATRVVALELLLAAQAADLRDVPLGRGTTHVRTLVRTTAPFVGAGDPLPAVEPLVELVRSGAFAT